jgi:hypothetical protein
VREFAAGPLFVQPGSLLLQGKGLGDDAIRALVEAPKLPAHLTRLKLDFPKVTAEGVALLLGSPLVDNLSRLDLGTTTGGAEVGRLLAARPRLARLTSLVTDGTVLGDEGVLALVRATNMPALTHLTLGEAQCTEACLDELAASPLLKQLEQISIKFLRAKNAQKLKALFKERLGEKAWIW